MEWKEFEAAGGTWDEFVDDVMHNFIGDSWDEINKQEERKMFGNRTNYAKQGWRLTSDDAQIEYRSHINGFECNDPNGWLSAPAHNDLTGQDGKIWWYWPVDRRELEDGGEWVKDWNKCNDIEIIE